ncbi:hypothetical protein [Serinibacter salmoneus]|uniref:Uncharacterized protein n=1 Tax=Serinibacter salmoneus TaxID=556530 RepID=A0A2A9D1H6_9MICO|nr:hypothetical protein [Serinibacter salmoneus]PFG20537.1 hypothetical protein ATL40_2141 [Serinibacter salmoneus]
MSSAPAPRPAPTPAALRRRRLLALVLALVLLGAGAGGVYAWYTAAQEPERIVLDPLPGETVTAPIPTPAIQPSPRATETALQQALPDAVLVWAVTEQTRHEEALAQGAVEAWTLRYEDGTGQEVAVTVSQWRTATEASERAAAGLPSEGSERGEVRVGSEVVGEVVSWQESGRDHVRWTNGATVIDVQAPAGAGTAFYEAFGM